jgi:hypothetical protein
MNGKILRPPGGRYSVLDISQADREKIAKVGTLAKNILSRQDQDHWARAGEPDLLPFAIAGAIILERIGQQSEAIIIEDDGAHLAFITCNALTLLASQLDRASLVILRDTLKTLAMCCPVETTIHDLPPLSCLPKYLQNTTLIRRQYDLIRDAVPGSIDITIADALALYRIFLVSNSPQFSAVLAEMTKISEGLRTGLERLKEAMK